MVNRRFVRLLLGLVLVLGAILLANRFQQQPQVAWQIGAASASRPASAYQEVGLDEPLRLAVEFREPLYVYVVSHDREDGTLSWWPSPMLQTDAAQPLPSGTHRLPGMRNGAEQSWPARPTLAVTDWIVVAARAPLPELDALLPRLRQASNTTFTDGSVVLSNPKDGLAPLGKKGDGVPHALLQEAIDLPKEVTPNGGMHPSRTPGVWLATLQVVAKKDSAGNKITAQPLDKLKQFEAQPPAGK
jgi:hypothetical protein